MQAGILTAVAQNASGTAALLGSPAVFLHPKSFAADVDKGDSRLPVWRMHQINAVAFGLDPRIDDGVDVPDARRQILTDISPRKPGIICPIDLETSVTSLVRKEAIFSHIQGMATRCFNETFVHLDRTGRLQRLSVALGGSLSPFVDCIDESLCSLMPLVRPVVGVRAVEGTTPLSSLELTVRIVGTRRFLNLESRVPDIVDIRRFTAAEQQCERDDSRRDIDVTSLQYSSSGTTNHPGPRSQPSRQCATIATESAGRSERRRDYEGSTIRPMNRMVSVPWS